MKRFFVALAAFGLAAAVATAQDFKAAVDAYNAGAVALETNKAEALAQFRTALTEAMACEGEEAQDLVAKCKEIIPSTLLSIAKEKINAAKYDEALVALEETKTVATDYAITTVADEAVGLIPNVYMRKGSTLLQEKNFAGAAEVFQQLTALQPENSQAQLRLGQAHMQAGNNEAAIAALTKAHELGEEQAGKLLSNVYLKLGQALSKANKFAEAIEALEKSIAFAESANAYKLMASAYTKSGKNAKAIEAYKKYLAVSPDAKDAADVMFTIAATAQKAGDKATATEYYKKLAGTKYAAEAEKQLKTLK